MTIINIDKKCSILRNADKDSLKVSFHWNSIFTGILFSLKLYFPWNSILPEILFSRKFYFSLKFYFSWNSILHEIQFSINSFLPDIFYSFKFSAPYGGNYKISVSCRIKVLEKYLVDHIPSVLFSLSNHGVPWNKTGSWI